MLDTAKGAPKMRVTIVFDEEDYITPAKDGLDDLLKMLADVMTEEKISGTFFLIGERARCLRDRGRGDVLDALSRHDLGSHINMGSIHPTVMERAEHSDWAEGCARMAAEELAGIDEIGAIFNKPIRSLARHGGSFCPQLLAVLGARNLPYVYSPARLPCHNITWYCNTLNFFEDTTVFQEAYLSRKMFLEAEKRFLDDIDARSGYDWHAVFNSHPCMIKTKEFWDMKNYRHGLNPPPGEWRTPDFRPNYSLQEARSNWALHCGRLRDNPKIQLGTINDFALEFGRQKEKAMLSEIMLLAQQAADAKAPFWSDDFSAAEILDLLARCYVMSSRGKPPVFLPRRNVLGPERMPLSVPTVRSLHPEALLRAACGIVAAIDYNGMLPSRIFCGGGTAGSSAEIGIGTAFAAIGMALTSGITRTIEARRMAPYPPEGDDFTAIINAGNFKGWCIHRQDLDVSSIARLSALQSWTLKPAWPISRFL